MVLTDAEIRKEVELFNQRIDEGAYAKERSQNNEVNYSEKKQKRDTLGVEAFAKSEMFEFIMKL